GARRNHRPPRADIPRADRRLPAELQRAAVRPRVEGRVDRRVLRRAHHRPGHPPRPRPASQKLKASSRTVSAYSRISDRTANRVARPERCWLASRKALPPPFARRTAALLVGGGTSRAGRSGPWR